MNRRELLKGAAVAAIGTAVVGPVMADEFAKYREIELDAQRITNLLPPIPDSDAATMGQLIDARTSEDADSWVCTIVQNSPEKRVFYIDVGGMPPNRAKRYLRHAMQTAQIASA